MSVLLCMLPSQQQSNEALAGHVWGHVARRFFTFWCIMFLVHQMGVGMFRLMGAIGRTLVIATSMGSIAVLIVVTMSGYVVAYPQACPNHPTCP